MKAGASHKLACPGQESAILPGCELAGREEFIADGLGHCVSRPYGAHSFGESIALYPFGMFTSANQGAMQGRFRLTAALLDSYNGLSEY
jgi:hypothetical protein